MRLNSARRENSKGLVMNKGKHPTVGRPEACMGVYLLGRAMLGLVGCGGHELRVCWSGLTSKPPEHIHALQQVRNDLARSFRTLDRERLAIWSKPLQQLRFSIYINILCSRTPKNTS